MPRIAYILKHPKSCGGCGMRWTKLESQTLPIKCPLCGEELWKDNKLASKDDNKG